MKKWKPRYAQMCQDLFAYLMLEKKTNLTYVDVGCRDPYENNNTWFLEKTLNFTGLSFDIIDYSDIWLKRNSVFIQEDGITADFNKIFKKYEMPNVIDYLTRDLEGNGDRYKGLINLPFDEYDFKVITIEHDAYRGYDQSERQPQRDFLESKGYVLVASNVCSHAGDQQEDWWINPKYISRDIYLPFVSESQKFSKIFKFCGYDVDLLYDEGERWKNESLVKKIENLHKKNYMAGERAKELQINTSKSAKKH